MDELFALIGTNATSTQRVHDLIHAIQRTPTSGIGKPEALKHQPPPIYKGKEIKIKFITQLPTKYPQFVFFCNLPQYVKDSYSRFVENQMRQMYDLSGVPIDLFWRKSS